MNKIPILFCVFLCFISGEQGLFAQKVSKVSFSELQNKLKQSPGDSITVVNFWATWCRPCVKELPYFEQFHQQEKQAKVRIWLVSLDFPEDVDKKLIPFVKQRKLSCPVFYLNERNPNDWVNQVAEEWSGAIPATVLYDVKGQKKAFHAGEFDYAGLKKWISENGN